MVDAENHKKVGLLVFLTAVRFAGIDNSNNMIIAAAEYDMSPPKIARPLFSNAALISKGLVP